jgi:dihydrofolate synthase/folylpolyglutamate synthase
MTYEEALAYLETFINYEAKTDYHYKAAFKLERMKKFLSNLGDPHHELKTIHVAGTKGKGSTACFIAHILKKEGFRVGLYTSPHLKDFRERIRILDPDNTTEERSAFSGMILKNDFVSFLDRLRPEIDFFRHSFQNFGALTFFEILTAIAFKFFQEKKTDFVVLETGLGGRFDATNAADSYVSVITPISYDHEHILGNTLAEIAFEKGGILKKSNKKTKNGASVCVTSLQPKEALEVLRRRAQSEGSVLFEMDRDFYSKKLSGDLFSQNFFYQGLNDTSHFFATRMLGAHQLVNASLAVAACEALSLHGINIRSDAMEKGLLNAFWPGRLEVIRTKPFIILDGAHNKDSAIRLSHFLEKEFKRLRKWLIFGVSEDKDIKGIAEQLEPLVDKVILTRADNPRAADPQRVLKPYFKNKTLAVTETVEEAVNILNKEIACEDVAVITGSLFVVGQARELWQK